MKLSTRVLLFPVMIALSAAAAAQEAQGNPEDNAIVILNTCWMEGSAFIKKGAPGHCPPWQSQAISDGCSDKACGAAKEKAVHALKKKLDDKGFPECSEYVLANSTCLKSDDCKAGKC